MTATERGVTLASTRAPAAVTARAEDGASSTRSGGRNKARQIVAAAADSATEAKASG